MAIYLYNLGISLQVPYTSQGRFFSASTSGLMQSGVWLTYQAGALPSWLQSQNVSFLTQPLNPANWVNPQPDTGPFPAQPGDYFVMRTFLSDTPAPAGCNLRMNVVFGRGTSAPASPTLVPLQSPLQMPTGLPRAVVDSDNSTPAQGPSSDNAWAYCMGMVYGGSNDYSFNVGVALIQGGNWYTFGHDPQLKITVPPGAVVAA